MIYTLPFIAALIGWFTNFIAVKMLFHPKEPVNFGVFKVQGIFPKRQKVLAEKLGSMVAKDLFSIDDLLEQIKSTDNSKTMVLVESKIDVFIDKKLSANMPMLAMFLNDDIKNKIKGALLAEISQILPEIIESYGEQLKDSVDIKKIVTEKVLQFSTDKLEEILYSIMKKEFRFIELLGAVLGFLIGIIQVVMVSFS
ncbi:MAG: uncharacterized membrane protein YheB (UPF0754 family) [Saprospiraceae bacterium]|jgi:uncharacterized membrane protein YheB (UPF0754 family)